MALYPPNVVAKNFQLNKTGTRVHSPKYVKALSGACVWRDGGSAVEQFQGLPIDTENAFDHLFINP
eukprot:m.97300 g.97300  ORF g.97300 m.97300 type:complete len:66 (+) comp16694_c1_seq1:448-645(+)